MKNKTFLLISLSLFIAILASSCVMAAELDDSTSSNSNSIAVANSNISIADTGSVDSVAMSKDINTHSNNLDNSNENIDNQIADDNANNIADTNIRDNSKEVSSDISTYGSSLAESNLNEDVSTYASNGVTSTVDGNATNQMDNPTIQTAINQASAGDTIVITGTHYVHTHLVIDKQLTIISTVGTIIETCPSNTQGSNGLGIFYISPSASGTVISGFTLINVAQAGDAVDPYAIYVNGANNVLITNCTVNKTTNGQGILIVGSKNTTISNTEVKEAKTGIIVKDSSETNITNDYIHGNSITGIVIGDGNSNINIERNNITGNTISGINLTSSNNINILNNKIYYNRDGIDQSRSKFGIGIYVNCNITKINIIGNFIFENGNYGVFNDYRVRNLNNQNLEVINDNYFGLHNTRAAFTAVYKESTSGDHDYNASTDLFYKVADGTGHYSQGTNPIFLQSNLYVGELFCGATYYAPGVPREEGPKDIIIGNISETSKGVYTVSFVYKNNNSIATGLNSVDVTFFLNKNNSLPSPQSGETYLISEVKNGIATVDFRSASFKSTKNNITAVCPGIGAIDGKNRPTANYNISDSNIPSGDENLVISVSDSTYPPKSGENFTAKLTDGKGNPLVGCEVHFNLTNALGKSVVYWGTTNTEGIAKLLINLEYEANYKIEASYKVNDTYTAANATITIAQKQGNTVLIVPDMSTIAESGENFTATLKDENGTVISGKDLIFTLTNAIGQTKDYWRTTNNEGVAKLPIFLTYPSTYTITCTFDGDSPYDAAGPTSGTLTVTAQKKT